MGRARNLDWPLQSVVLCQLDMAFEKCADVGLGSLRSLAKVF